MLFLARESPVEFPGYVNNGLDTGQRRVRIAHGVIMAVVFIALKPAGAMLLRTIPGRMGFKIHVGWELSSWLIAVSGVGMGIYLAHIMGRFGKAHPIIGLIVMAEFVIQPILGHIHHQIFKTKHQRTYWAVAHVWLGRILLILGLINGGLGLQAADNTVKGEIAYGVLAGASFVAYVTLVLFLKYRSKKPSEGEKP